MVAKYPVGKSSYGDLRGITQYVSSARMALQVLSVIIDFNAYLRSKGRSGSLSVNEGMRSRARQTWLWVHRFILGVVVAMPFTSRHDEVLRGNAIDFGITMPDGSNRALSPDEFARLHEIVQGRGGTWTGVNFGEPWHHEMATRTEAVPPYADARARLEPKPTKPTKAKPSPKPKSRPKRETEMIGIQSTKTEQYRLIGETTAQELTRAEAVVYSHGVAGDGNFFQRMSSEDCKTHLRLVEERRKQANLPILQAITAAIAKES